MTNLSFTWHRALAELDKLDKAIPDLEIFRGSIEVYISWWSDVDIRQVSTSQRSDISITSYAPERLKDLKKQWTRLMDDYRDYAHQVLMILFVKNSACSHSIRHNRSRSCRDAIQNLLEIRESVSTAKSVDGVAIFGGLAIYYNNHTTHS